ncbi:hypothetical protein X474_11020 [Dethiosulfatarculus sandiegensis]|uniref:Uncharacterized protein n=1 Tax=Dethiosulfatarculus sandiegensis TaxID=1429043 RepID=A0A0D2JW29_9BACT|nr:hypothetical protein X474_11020 [Dethiosulfatarculus sandiegensis]
MRNRHKQRSFLLIIKPFETIFQTAKDFTTKRLYDVGVLLGK